MQELIQIDVGAHIVIDGLQLHARDMASYLYVYSDAGFGGFPEREETNVNRFFLIDKNQKQYCLDIPGNADPSLLAFYEMDKKKTQNPGKKIHFKTINVTKWKG